VQAIGPALTFILIYGVSYGVVLFTMSIGLVLTMGLMKVVNLAHGAFAAIGGYLAITLMERWDVPFLAATAIAVALVAAFSVLVERLVYVHIYRASELDQVLMTIGLMFMAIAGLNFFYGPNVLPAHLPPFLDTQIHFAGRDVQSYRIFVVVVGALIVIGLWYVFDRTGFGARLRAAVDSRGMAEAVGIDVSKLFSIAFAIGSGLAALGGAIGYGMLPLEPLYPFKYLTLILIIVAVSGFGNMKSSFIVAIAIGLLDTTGRYLLPEYGAFFIYAFLVAFLLFRSDIRFFGRRA
jgi:branched-chain amino acid transport system permease protein